MKLFIFLLVLIATVFCFAEKIFSKTDQSVVISAIQTSGVASDDDFIELYNPTCKDIDLADWKIMKKTKTNSTAAALGTLKGLIPAKGYFLWENIKNTTTGNPDYTTKTYYLSDDYSIAIVNKEGKQIDSITWGSNQNPFDNSLVYPDNPKKSESLRRDSNNTFSLKENYSPKNSSFIEKDELDLCPKEIPEEKTYSNEITLNELFPAPSADKEEFIEIYNPSEKDTDLSGWILRDGSKTGKYIFPDDTILKSNAFLVVYKKDFKFALNNSGGEKVLLFDPSEKEISHVEYSSAKTDYAYAFDGEKWHWTSKPTPRAENEFNELLSGKIKKDKTIYAGTYANFETKSDKNTKKFVWDFGDGHKSYLKKTRHKYEKSGTYHASLKITGEGEDNLLSFDVKVEKFGKPKVRIAALSANPAGKDSEKEWLSISNDTKKQINLKNWSVATGWKNLYNHPIKKDFILKAGETKKLTRNLSAFTLGNKQAKIELRYPNGKVADKLKYDHKEKSVAEDELYQKDGKNWQWILSQKGTEEKRNSTEIKLIDTTPEIKIEESQKADFDLSDLGKSTENPTWRQKQRRQFTLLFAGSNISPTKLALQSQGQVLGVSKTSLSFEKTGSTNFLDQIWKKINAKLNQLVLIFS